MQKSNVKDMKRLGIATDYAISQGVFPVSKDNATSYYTRSPYDNKLFIDYLNVLIVDESARVANQNASLFRCGVRPMIRIKKN